MRLLSQRGLVLLALFALPSIACADAISDQKKAYEKLGIKLPHPPAMCSLLTKGEVARYLGKAVSDGESAGSVSGCAYRAADRSNDGVLVTRQARDAWYPPTKTSQYQSVSGVGEKAYTAFEPGLGFEAGVLASTGVTNVQFSGKGSAADALALARIAMKR